MVVSFFVERTDEVCILYLFVADLDVLVKLGTEDRQPLGSWRELGQRRGDERCRDGEERQN